jgi:hypothetical protein
MLDWCAVRWKIGTFHKILKSGCEAEKSRFHTADRITSLIAVSRVLSWRICGSGYSARAPHAITDLAFSVIKIVLLERVVDDTPHNAQASPLLLNVIRLAQLGDNLAPTSLRRETPSCGKECDG